MPSFSIVANGEPQERGYSPEVGKLLALLVLSPYEEDLAAILFGSHAEGLDVPAALGRYGLEQPL